MATIVLKIVIVLAGALIGARLTASSRFLELPERRFLPAVMVLQAALSFGLFFALFVVGGQQVTSDVPGYYMPAGHAVLAGHVPYRDFPVSYAPLFAYISAGLLLMWNSGKMFALFAILLNLLTLCLWHWAADQSVGDRAAREASVLYATSGHVIVQTLLGTNQIWVAAALAGSCLLLVRGSSVSSGLVQALSVCATKMLALLFWPLLWMFAPRRTRWLAAALLPAAAVHASFTLIGAAPLDAWRSERTEISPGNLPYLLGPLVGTRGMSTYSLFDALALLALGATTLWLYLHRAAPGRWQRFFAGLALTGLIFMMVSKKSFTAYAVFFMYPLILAVTLGIWARASRVALLAAWNVLMATEGLWFHLGGNGLSLQQWLRAPGSSLGPVIFIGYDLALLACYACLAAISAQCVLQAEADRGPAVPQPAPTARSG
jgi:hypothetical protein